MQRPKWLENNEKLAEEKFESEDEEARRENSETKTLAIPVLFVSTSLGNKF